MWSAGRTSINSSGFALIELVIVLLLLALLSAAALPRLSGVVDGVRLKSGAGKAVSVMRYARSRAIYLQAPVKAVFDIKGDLWWIEEDQRGGRSKYRSASRLSGGVDIKGFRYTDGSYADQRALVRFYPTGSSSGGELMLSVDGRSAVVHIEPFTGLAHADF